MITQDEVQHIAKLSKLKLKPEEIEKFTDQLSGILGFFGELSEVNTDQVKETSQVTGLENQYREGDEIEICENIDDHLKCSPHPIENHSVKVPKIM